MTENGWSQSKTAREFAPKFPNLKLTQPLISAWVKDEAKWRAQFEEEKAKGRAAIAKRIRQFEIPELEEGLELWIVKALGDGVSLSGELIR